MEIPIYHNKRDLEISLTLELLKYEPQLLKDGLKIGLDFTGELPLIADKILNIDGVGKIEDKYGIEFLRTIYKENFIIENLSNYDFIYGLSTINRLMIKDLEGELLINHQIYAVEKAVELSRRYVFLTFEYGVINIFKNDFICYDRNILKRIEERIINHRIIKKFFFNVNEENEDGWEEISQKDADKFLNIKHKKDRCLCCLIIKK